MSSGRVGGSTFGQGVKAPWLTDPSQLLPTPMRLAQSAIADADKWWGTQGRTPPPVQFTIAPSVDGERNGYGYYNSGRMQVTPEYLANLGKTLRTSSTRHGSVEALVGLWRLMAHERGHNLGYQHVPGGIMDETWAGPPGQAYTWARGMLPRGRRH